MKKTVSPAVRSVTRREVPGRKPLGKHQKGGLSLKDFELEDDTYDEWYPERVFPPKEISFFCGDEDPAAFYRHLWLLEESEWGMLPFLPVLVRVKRPCCFRKKVDSSVPAFGDLQFGFEHDVCSFGCCAGARLESEFLTPERWLSAWHEGVFGY